MSIGGILTNSKGEIYNYDPKYLGNPFGIIACANRVLHKEILQKL